MNAKSLKVDIDSMKNEPKSQASAVPQPPAAPPSPPKFTIPNSKFTIQYRPRSTIARLPHSVREMLNVALREGEAYVIISARIAKLVGNAHPYITPAMFSR